MLLNLKTVMTFDNYIFFVILYEGKDAKSENFC